MEIDPIKHTVIIPAYNEAEGLAIVLQKVYAATNGAFEVLVIDDGSTDGTSQVAAQFPCRIIRHEVNRGKADALRTGIQNARGDNIIWIDADDTYPAQTIPDIAAALANGYELVYASRSHGRDNIPAFNRIGNYFFMVLTHMLYGFKPADPCTGLCGVKKTRLEQMALSSKHFGIEAEIAVKAGRMRLNMADMPITYGRRVGQGKLNGVKAGFGITVTILRHLFWRPAKRQTTEGSPD